jgi:hypothetical protein
MINKIEGVFFRSDIGKVNLNTDMYEELMKEA